MRAAVTVVGSLLGAGCGADQAAAPLDQATSPVVAAPLPDLVLEGFQQPAAALHDPVADVYLVASLIGEPFVKDGKGAISRVTPAGRVEREWIVSHRRGAELNAPMGMAIAGTVLYVADIDVVRVFARELGTPLSVIPIPGATALVGVATTPDGEVWLTDAGAGPSLPNATGAIFVIGRDGAVRTIAKGRELGGPRGLVVLPGGGYCVTWDSGEFVQIDGKGRRTPLLKTPRAQLDGLVRLAAGRWLCSSWAGHCLYELDSKGGVRTHDWPGLAEPAGLGCDAARGRVLVPLRAAGRVLVRQL